MVEVCNMLSWGDILNEAAPTEQSWTAMGQIGKGTCCEVYKVCSRQESKRKAALKIYRTGIQFAHAHDAEAMLLDLVCRANGTCKNLVKTYSDFDHKERPCLLQELLDLDLRQLLTLSQGQGLSLCLIQKLTLDIFRGLAHLHKSGFVHADLKPANLMWSPRESCLKIIDFSLSFHVQDKVVERIQSLGYRAPEVEKWNTALLEGIDAQSSSENHLHKPSKPSDMWSVGCIVAEMFVGNKVFTKKRLEEFHCSRNVTSTASLMSQFVQSSILPRKTQESLPLVGELANFLDRLLHVEVEGRCTVEQGLDHVFLKNQLSPDFQDLCLLPSSVLRLLNVVDEDDLSSDQAYHDLALDLMEECVKYGPVSSCVIPRDGPGKGKVYVMYTDWEDAQAAYSKLGRRIYNSHTVVASYFPTDAFNQQKLF